MQVVAVSPEDPRGDRIDRAGAVLRAGGVVALPTETFYGLAVDAFNARAVGRLNRLKGKPADSPVLLLLADLAQARLVCDELPESFEGLALRFWPGPLSLIVPAGRNVPREVSGVGRTVAVRVPGLALPRRLARSLGRPISGVSANRHGEPPSRNAREVTEALPEGIDLVLDGGPAPGGAPSTIVDLTSGRPRVVREGLLPVESLRAVVEVEWTPRDRA